MTTTAGIRPKIKNMQRKKKIYCTETMFNFNIKHLQNNITIKKHFSEVHQSEWTHRNDSASIFDMLPVQSSVHICFVIAGEEGF